MHIYIYDSFLNQKKYDKVLARLETRITDLGLNGKISRLSIIKNISDIIDYELKRGAKTIVAVGNDNTVNQIANCLAGSNVPLGIIPIEEKGNNIAKSLGIDSLATACDVLSARRITKIDLGYANNIYFLASASIANQGTVLEISKNFSIEILEKGIINIINLNPADKELPKDIKFNPQDGILELLIKTNEPKGFLIKKSCQSIFPIKKITIKNKKLPVIIDGTIEIPTPVEISVLNQKLSVIVGKNRNF